MLQSQNKVRLFQTLEHACGYHGERIAVNLVVDPTVRGMAPIYDGAIQKGFRRSGPMVYRPNCPACQACISARIAVEQFTPNRAQRRCWQRNSDLDIRWTPARLSDAHVDLFTRYVGHRHEGGGMDGDGREELERFIYSSWQRTQLLELRLSDALVGVAVTDLLTHGLSAVYTFFDPDLRGRSLGTYALLRQLERVKQFSLPYLYLGYWIEGHPKMDYKSRFRAVEVLRRGSWVPLTEAMTSAPTTALES